MLNYLRAHWHGRLSLSKSFWLNGVGITIGGILLISLGFIGFIVLGYRQVPLSLGTVFVFVSLYAVSIVVTIWQAVGIWRAARAGHRSDGWKRPQNRLWPVLAQALVLVYVFQTVWSTRDFYQLQKSIYMLATSDAYNAHVDYENGTTIRIKGVIGPATARKIADLLATHDGITTLVMDSPGGLVPPGLSIAEMVEKYGLITIASGQCISACLLPLFASSQAGATPGSILGFHRPTPPPGLHDNPLIAGANIEQAELVIRERYLKSGLPQLFIDRIFAPTAPLYYWVPKSELVGMRVLKHIFASSSRDIRDSVDARVWCRQNPGACTAKPDPGNLPQFKNLAKPKTPS